MYIFGRTGYIQMFAWDSMPLDEQKRRLKAHLVFVKSQDFKRVSLPNSIEWTYKYYNKIYDVNNNVTVWVSKDKVKVFLCRGTAFNIKYRLSAAYIRDTCAFLTGVVMSWHSPRHTYSLEAFEDLISTFGELFVYFLFKYGWELCKTVERPEDPLCPDP